MKRLRYETPRSEFLAYETDPVHYIKKALDYTLPEKNLDLLRHLTNFGSFVDVLMTRLPDDTLSLVDRVTRKERAIDRVDLHQVMNVAWRWHMEIVGRNEPLLGLYASSLFISWSVLCHVFYLSLYENEERSATIHLRTAKDYPFYARLSASHHMDICNSPLSQYTVNDLWDSMRFITTYGLYTERYDKDMQHYLQDLFYHYCGLFCVKNKNLENLLDNPRFVALGECDEKLRVEVAPGYILKSAFFFEGELLFQNQLYRMILSDMLDDFRRENPLILRESVDDRESSNEAWFEFMKLVCNDVRLGDFIVTDFKEQVFHLQLFHGEMTRFKRQWPEATCQPSDVLSMSRQSDHFATTALHRMLPIQLCEAFMARGEHEREVVFLTRQATQRWLLYERVELAKDIEKLFVLEELCEVTDLMAFIIREESEKPLLLCLVLLYYVIQGNAVYTTRDFRDAYFIWLHLLTMRGLDLPDSVSEILGDSIASFAII